MTVISPAPRVKVEYTACLGCGGTLKHHPRQRNPKKWCSEACRQKALRAASPEYVRRQATLAAERHRATYVPASFDLLCEVCGTSFTARRSNRKYCSRPCSNRSYAQRRQADGRAAEMGATRRAREVGAKVQGGRRLAVLEADKWICHLCGGPTDPHVLYPHRDYPVVDHVVPLAKGGEHGPSNWRTAHNRCNSQRRDLSVEEYREKFLTV